MEPSKPETHWEIGELTLGSGAWAEVFLVETISGDIKHLMVPLGDRMKLMEPAPND